MNLDVKSTRMIYVVKRRKHMQRTVNWSMCIHKGNKVCKLEIPFHPMMRNPLTQEYLLVAGMKKTEE